MTLMSAVPCRRRPLSCGAGCCDVDGEEIVNTPAFVTARLLPPACEPCEFRETCHGGCAGRRQLRGALDEPDSYCPIIRGERPQLDIRMAAARDLPKIGSACTTVVIARD